MVVFEKPMPCHYDGNRTFGSRLYSDLPGKKGDDELKAIVTAIGMHAHLIAQDEHSNKKYFFVMGRKIDAARKAGAREMPTSYIDRIRGQ